jgi:cell division protein FtsW (lipid II flippase)
MAITYTTAAERDVRRVHHRGWSVAPLDLALGGASVLAALLMFSAYQGAFASPRTADVSTPVVNLNTVADPQTLEAVFEPVLPMPGDRRLAARELFAFLVQADGARRTLPNVGAIARVRVPDTTIDRAPTAAAYRDRLREERARAAGVEGPRSVPLLTSAQLAAIKPSLVVRDRAEVRNRLLLWCGLYLIAFHAVFAVWRWRGLRGDCVLLTAAHVLTAVGFAAMVSRPDPLRDLLLFVRYAEGVVAGLTAAAVLSFVNLRTGSLRNLSYLPLLGAFVLSFLLLVPGIGSGPAGSNAKVNLGPFQPIEAIRILLALFLAGYFARHWELLRAVRSDGLGDFRLPSWINVPRARYAVPVVVGVGAALALFFLQKDLGPALMLAVVFLAAYGIARGTAGLMLAGVVLLAAGFFAGHRMGISATLADRVRMWQAPWDNVARGGDQIAQALWSMSTGGLFGTGLGLGDTRYLPAGHTDLVLAAVAEELGFAGLAVVGLLYVAIIVRALATARRATTDYAFFLATVLALFLAVPVLLMASGTLGIVPLTGVVTPFLSFGGSAMLANFAALGLLTAIRSDTGPPADLQVFRAPVRLLGGSLGVAALVLLIVAARVQVFAADEIVVKPHLGVQADGMRRYQYNPRILDLARRIPRGTIVDREGMVLATDDHELLRKPAAAYARLGISLDSACPDRTARCYPLGGRAFHLLGDAGTRTNWSATNTSFVERDSEARLRGYDDHQTPVAIVERDGTPGTALRRDYRDLVPVLRHRHDPGHPAVKAVMGHRRELRLTIDARLQVRVAAIVAQYARRSASGRAAAVVLDPATGDLLASVSYPWPSDADLRTGATAREMDVEALLDRARYGLYPPGSTFKLMTATAALRRDAGAGAQTFTCRRLPDNRVGAQVPGYARPIRDDVLDRHPHGTIDLHRALVVSCNAYFAQLAVRLGPQPLLGVAQRAEIPLAVNNAGPRIRDTLPQIGYGQGEVVASPLRMARLAAAIAADGVIRDVRVDGTAPAPAAHELLPAGTARTLGRFMRDVVLDGTGRSLRGGATAIAGKTGTAEIAGAPSHSWFVGFAPYGPSTPLGAGPASRRIAVAVILENAGYGGAGAAPAAGEIVAAAAAAGLVR